MQLVASVPSRCSVRLNIDSERKHGKQRQLVAKYSLQQRFHASSQEKQMYVVSLKRYQSIRDEKGLTVVLG